MQETISIARHILDEHHKYFTKNEIDDAEMAHELKFILEGVNNYLIEKKAPKKEIKAMLDGLREYAKVKYMKLYIGNIGDDEGLTDNKKVKKGRDSLLDLKDIAVETGIKDLAEHHDHYLYGVS